MHWKYWGISWDIFILTEFRENNNNLHLHGTLHITFCIKWLNFEVSDRQSYVTSRRSLLKVGGAWAEHLIGNTWYIKVQVKLCWKVGPGRGGTGWAGWWWWAGRELFLRTLSAQPWEGKYLPESKQNSHSWIQETDSPMEVKRCSSYLSWFQLFCCHLHHVFGIWISD